MRTVLPVRSRFAVRSLHRRAANNGAQRTAAKSLSLVPV